MKIQSLIQQSFEAKKFSYSPYSKFAVGAALLCQDGTVVTGCNVENAAYAPAICAERCAYTKAISMGQKEFKAIAISSNLDDFIAPCGVCRQTMVEFSEDIDVYMTKPDGTYKMMKITELLPHSFRPSRLLQ
ncbi:CDA [Bugula neritina]|uniref:Cytidine deaminase n=1 Tax=Bugula neritina TaxID=10212 RepID=A0A7J7KDM6_BUGNE|nr:CDA [Bugula neritina]